jgi:hypothetical protein
VSPTLSELALWTDRLQDVLKSLPSNDTASIVRRSTYYEMDVVSASPSRVYGSCAAWSSLLGGELRTAQITNKIASITLKSVSDLLPEAHTQTIATTFVTCDVPTVAASIVSSVTSATVAERTFACGANTWRLKRCPSVGSNTKTTAAICVNCADPCVPTAYCGSSSAAPMLALSPCAAHQCSAPAYDMSGIRLLSVGLANVEAPPKVVSALPVVAATSIVVTIQLSSAGTVYCAVFRDSASTNAPTSVAAILRQNLIGATDATNSTTISVSGLDAATAYRLYYLTASPSGVQSSLQGAVASVSIVTTACCKLVAVTVQSTTVFEKVVAANMGKLTLSAAPSYSLQGTLSVFSISLSTGEAVVYPGSLLPTTFSATPASWGAVSVSVPALPPGTYEIRVVLTGDSRAEFSVDVSGARFEVLSTATVPPTPQLSQAVFAQDGSYITISFTGRTNRGGLLPSFPCGKLFAFACAATATCLWADDSTIRASVVTSGAAVRCVAPAMPLQLLNSSVSLRARCPAAGDTGNGAACYQYPTWKTVAPASTVVLAPVSPVTPVVSISAPTVLGTCDDLTLDVSGSTGSGGRPWDSFAYTVSSGPGINVTALAAALRRVTATSPPLRLPAQLLLKGVNYNFGVRLCNFLGQCGFATKQGVVVNDSLPSVSILGAPLRTVLRKDSLLVSASASLSRCDGSKSSAGIQYTWRVASGGVELPALRSTSKDPSKFLLAAYSLSAGSSYDISVTAAITGASQSSSTAVQAFVRSGAVQAVIKGGYSTALRIGEKLTVDASGSYDEDRNGVYGASAGLFFSWSCVQTAPVFNSTCSGLFDRSALGASAAGEAYILVSLPGASEGTAQVALLVTDAARERTASVQISVTVLPALAPVVTVSAPAVPATGIVNAGQGLQLTGMVSVPASLGGNATWTVDDESVDMKSALLPSLLVIPPATAVTGVTKKTVFMAFAGNTLPPGRTLTFSLTGRIPYLGKTAISSITVTINAPPSPGTFYVDPADGVELEQKFQFIAQQWVDTDLPLTYQFGYDTNTGVSVVLKSRSESPYGSSLLTAGIESASYVVSTFAQIYDSLGANSTARSAVTVRPHAGMNSSDVSRFIAGSLTDAANDADGIMQATAMASYLMNSANCSLAPNCSALHRKQCSVVAHTCGACESDQYIGEFGDSNEACFSLNQDRLLRASAWLEREVVEKTCAANCSSHGTCIAVQRDSGYLRDDSADPCMIGSTDCDALCLCDGGYDGAACEFTAAEYLERQENRLRVVQAVQTLVDLQNADEQAIAGWASGLQQAVQASTELSADAALSALKVTDLVVGAAAGLESVSSASAVAVGLLAAVNSAARSASVVAVRRRLQGGHRALTSESHVDHTVIKNLLNSVGSLVARGMTPGQSAASFSGSEFRMSVSVAPSDAANDTTIIAVPQTAMESYHQQAATSAMLPASIVEGMHMVVSTTRLAQYSDVDAELNSNPLTVYTSGPPCDAPPCRVKVVLQNSNAIDFEALVPVAGNSSVNATCTVGDFSSHNATCPNGRVVTLQCNGTAGVLVQPCPVLHYSAVCNTITGGMVASGADSGCVVETYTDTEVICSCELLATRRSLQSSQDNFTQPDGYSVSYVSMLSVTADTFASTVLTADDLNASTLARGWRALATLGALSAAIVVGLFWSHHQDSLAKRVEPAPETPVGAQPKATKAKGVLKGAASAVGKRVRFNVKKKALVNAELALVEESLPRVLSSRNFSDRFLEEVKQHHRWFGIVFYYSDAFPRVLRVMSLATNAIVMLFIQSITYNLTNPDDGSCALLTTEAECIVPTSPFATGESKCAWVYNAAASKGECAYVEPDQSVRIILFVAIFCAIVTTPIALMADWVIGNVLAAPTKAEVETGAAKDSAEAKALAISAGVVIQARPLQGGGDGVSNLAVVPTDASGNDSLDLRKSFARQRSRAALFQYIGVLRSAEKEREEKEILGLCRAELLMLSSKLRSYRETLTPDQREEFNGKCTCSCGFFGCAHADDYCVVLSALGPGRGREIPHPGRRNGLQPCW